MTFSARAQQQAAKMAMNLWHVPEEARLVRLDKRIILSSATAELV